MQKMTDIFDDCRKINTLIDEENESQARNDLIKMLDFLERENVPYTPLINHLIRKLGLYPYIQGESADWQEQFVCRIFETDIGGGKKATLHREQSRLLKALLSGEDLAISAPTSFGKSFVIDAFIAIQKPKNVVIIVPTIALTDETRRRLYKKFANQYKIITTTDVEISEQNIFIFPQERAIGYLDIIPELDILIVDEFYKADSRYDDERSSALLRVIAALKDKAKQRYFLAPNIQKIQENPFTEGMKFMPFDLNTVFLEKYDFYKFIRKNQEEKSKALLSLIKKYHNRKTLIYAGTHTEISNLSTLLLADTPPQEVSPVLQQFMQWLSKNYLPTWVLPKLVSRATGIHNGRLHRSLTQIQVKLFEEENGLMRLISTTSIVEGVNTSAENIIIWKNKKGIRNLDDFTYKNIIGRGGRMFKHFVGKIYLLEEPPPAESQTLELNIDEDTLINFDDMAEQILTPEQIRKLKATQEEIQNVIGAECYNEIFESNNLQNSEFSLFKSIAQDMKIKAHEWNGLRYLNSNNPEDWGWLLMKILRFQGGAWGEKYSIFVEFVKILSTNWESTIPEMLEKTASLNIDIDKFFELERIVSFKLSSLLRDINIMQQSILKHLSVDLSPIIHRVSYAFLPPIVYQLEEYGLPRMISRKIHNAGIINLENSETNLHTVLNNFRDIEAEEIKNSVPLFDEFDKYVLDYFFDGIRLNASASILKNEL